MWYPLFTVVGVLAVTAGVTLVSRSRSSAGQSPGHERRNKAASVLGVILLALVAPGACVLFLLPALKPEYWLASVAEAGDEIVRAVEEFSRRTGSPPEVLTKLVPEYLHAIPSPGYPGSSGWEYRTHEGEWSLCVPIDSALLLDWDEFRYSPRGEPEAGYRRFIRRGSWLYLDE